MQKLPHNPLCDISDSLTMEKDSTAHVSFHVSFMTLKPDDIAEFCMPQMEPDLESLPVVFMRCCLLEAENSLGLFLS